MDTGAAMVAACLVVLTACGAAPEPALPSGPAPAPVALPSPTPTPGPSAGPDLASRLDAAMLTPDEVGAGFTTAPYRRSAADERFTCGQPGLAARFDTLAAGAATSLGTGLLVIETAHVFADVPTAQRGYAAVDDGLSCRAGTTIDGAVATIGPPRDVTVDVGGDQAQRWDIDAGGTRVVVISVQAAQAVVAFSFVAEPGVDPAAQPDPVAVAARGVAKLLAA